MQNELENFYEIVFKFMGWNFDITGRHSYIKDILSAYPNCTGGFWVGVVDNKIIGTVAIRILDKVNYICELKSMYVLPSFQGKGYGRRLLEHALDQAKQLDYKIIRLDTTSELKQAISLYSKYGFYEISRYNDNKYAEIFMEKNIT